jgi:Chromosome segregation ATPases
MSNELESARDLVIANQINYIKYQTAQVCLHGSIEIGRLLCEAKELVAHGEWGDWLEQNVSYSQSNANLLMRIYREYGQSEQVDLFNSNRTELFGKLSPSQAVALFALPEGEREEFVQSHDMENMSTRDITAEIKARQEAEHHAEVLADELAAAKSFAKSSEAELKKEADKLRAELKTAKDSAGKPSEKEKAKIKAEVEADYKKKLAAAEEKNRQLKVELENARTKTEDDDDDDEPVPAIDREAVKAEIAAEYEARIARLEDEKKASAKYASAGDVEVQKFAVHFETFQDEFNKLSGCLIRLEERSPETVTKLRSALCVVIEKMGKSVEV